MSARNPECEGCGITAADLPDGLDPDMLFERAEDGQLLCQGCLTG